MSVAEKGKGSFSRHIWRDAQAIRDAKIVGMLDAIIKKAQPDVSDEQLPELRQLAITTPTVPKLIRRRWSKVVNRHEARQQKETKA